MWCVETQSWESASAQVVTVFTHIVKLLQFRVLTHGFTPVASLQLPFACLFFLCLVGLWALLQLLFLFPLSPPQAGGHLPRMELLLRPLSGLLFASYSHIPSPNVPPGPIFFLFGGKNPVFGVWQLLPGLPEGSALLWRILWRHTSCQCLKGGHLGNSMSALLQPFKSAGNSLVWEGKVLWGSKDLVLRPLCCCRSGVWWQWGCLLAGQGRSEGTGWALSSARRGRDLLFGNKALCSLAMVCLWWGVLGYLRKGEKSPEDSPTPELWLKCPPAH